MTMALPEGYTSEGQVTVCLVGEPAVGKTSWGRHLEQGARFDQKAQTLATIGTDVLYLPRHLLPAVKAAVSIVLFDTPGNMGLSTLVPGILRSARVILLVFDLTRRATFDAIASGWPAMLRDYCPTNPPPVVVLLGNKVDLPHDRVVVETEGRRLANELKCSYYYEVSAKTWPVEQLRLPLDIALTQVVQRHREWRAAREGGGVLNHMAKSAHGGGGGLYFEESPPQKLTLTRMTPTTNDKDDDGDLRPGRKQHLYVSSPDDTSVTSSSSCCSGGG